MNAKLNLMLIMRLSLGFCSLSLLSTTACKRNNQNDSELLSRRDRSNWDSSHILEIKVRLADGDSRTCLGSLVSTNPPVALTAAHCLLQEGSNSYYNTQQFEISYQNGKAQATRLMVHPAFLNNDESKRKFDIGKIEMDIPPSSTTRLSLGNHAQLGDRVNVASFGPMHRNSLSRRSSNTLTATRDGLIFIRGSNRDRLSKRDIEALQAQAGSPLMNANGQIIGINSAVVVDPQQDTVDFVFVDINSGESRQLLGP